MENTNLLTFEDIIKLLKVSRAFVTHQLRNENLDWDYVQEGKKNRSICVCKKEKLLQHIAENSKVYYYDVSLPGFNEKKRPALSEIDMPEQLKKEILSGDFQFMNAEDVLNAFNVSSRETIYQRMYKHGILLLKFKGKSYFWLNL